MDYSGDTTKLMPLVIDRKDSIIVRLTSRFFCLDSAALHKLNYHQLGQIQTSQTVANLIKAP